MQKNSFQSLLQRFFLERLMKQQNVSPCTVSSYRDTFRIFLHFMKENKHCASSKITIEMLNAENVIEFLNYLELTRKNSIKTRNNRLAAIHSFVEYVSYQAPEYLGIIQRVRNVPFKKTQIKAVAYLIKGEVEAILDACDVNCWLGRRDLMMIAILYNTGVRVSELASIQKHQISLNRNGTSSLRILGKGRKERTIPIWKSTQQYIAEFLKETGSNDEDYLFSSKYG
ncbi:tyrosine-type recombinase/integrase, partial [Bacillus sp. DJP31]|uniref:tyrosine-type recombinase/integrase n=1 Tax=Bacillus sp. DJP31 TaxID=3409789 RepID=UPI003BB71F64